MGETTRVTTPVGFFSLRQVRYRGQPWRNLRQLHVNTDEGMREVECSEWRWQLRIFLVSVWINNRLRPLRGYVRFSQDFIAWAFGVHNLGNMWWPDSDGDYADQEVGNG